MTKNEQIYLLTMLSSIIVGTGILIDEWLLVVLGITGNLFVVYTID